MNLFTNHLISSPCGKQFWRKAVEKFKLLRQSMLSLLCKDLEHANHCPPAYVTQSEELYDKPLDPQVARRLIGFIAPYKWQMLRPPS